VSEDAILQVESLDVRYGPLRALFDVSLEVPKGAMVALLGPNGAGKSTFGRAVSGLIPIHGGQVLLEGHNISRWPPHKRSNAGISYIPEGRGIFPGLSVMDNLKMAVRQAGVGKERDEAIKKAIDLFPVLGTRRNQRAGSLSGGEQQMLALARALAITPKVVVADEMSLGLAPLVVDAVFEGLDQARKSGITVVLIEQFIHRALAMADSCVILQRGVVSWSGPASEAGEEVLARYLGEAVSV